MDVSRWERVESICAAAMNRHGHERTAYLAEACGRDESLRQEVESLLAHYHDDPDYLEKPVVRVSGQYREAATEPPHYIGPYRLIRTVGRGGMGEVYLAVQEHDDFRQSVALKVIRRGMDTDDVLERFRLERRILASLRHPNIAQLMDGGATEDGRPYFVMEFVEGLAIDEYCDRHRLSIADRCILVQTVCTAVQHAHQNLVVHRDIKPSNILVTPDGIPKLLDFGIGKVLTDTDSIGPVPATRTGLRVLTPEYASPEQLRGEPVTTASDVYGLGILLYELLSGHHPHADGSVALTEIERAVRDRDPERPSTAVARPAGRTRGEGPVVVLSPREIGSRRGTDPFRLARRLTGDLDNIVLKALRREPARRYASATALAEDLQRHLDGRPVRARPDTFLYRAGKFLKRNPWGVAAAAAVFLALTATSVVTTTQSRRVVQERDKLREVQAFLLEMFGASGAGRATGDSVTARQLLDGQVAALDGYTDQPELMAQMMTVLAEGYERLGLYDDAESLARQALVLRREHLGSRHPDVAASLNALGWIVHQNGNSREAEELLREALALRRTGGRGERVGLARTLNDLGAVREVLGDYEEAVRLHRQALDLRGELYAEDHRSIAVSASNLAAALYRLGDLEGAVQNAERALDILRRTVGPDHQRSIIVQSNLAAFKIAQGDYDAAESEYRDLLTRQTRVQGADHPVTLHIAVSLATVLSNQHRMSEAEPILRRALADQESALGPTHPDLATTLNTLAKVLGEMQDRDKAIELYQRALAIQRQHYGEAPAVNRATLFGISKLTWESGRHEAALPWQRSALSAYETSLGPGNRETIVMRARLASMLLDLGRPAEALPVYIEAHDASLKNLVPAHELTHSTRLRLAQTHVALGDLDRADSLIAASQAGLDAGEGTDGNRRELARSKQRLDRARSTASPANRR